MKAILLLSFIFSTSLFADANFGSAPDYGYLKPEDQKYYHNDTREGNNARERIDSLVKEVNKMYGEMSSMKAEIQALRKDVDELKKK